MGEGSGSADHREGVVSVRSRIRWHRYATRRPGGQDAGRRVGVLILVLLAGCAEPHSVDRPNIVLMIADDYGYPHYGFMGSQDVRTPNLDSLAESGAVFTHAHNTGSSCRPSLLTLLTGIHPYRWGAHLESRRMRSRRRSAEAIAQIETLPRLLATRGYASFQSGKYWEGTYEAGGFSSGMAKGVSKNAAKHVLKMNKDGSRKYIMEPVRRFIDAHLEEPFFLWFAPSIPHTPYNPPQAIKDSYLGKGLSANAWLYYSACTDFDALVGELLATLDERGLREKTLIVFLADNGWDQPPDAKSTGPRGKRSLHELGFRTPIIFSLPEAIRRGRRIESLVSTLDLVPTLLDYAGVPAPAHLVGTSLRPAIEGNAQAGRELLVGAGRVLPNRFHEPQPWGFYVRTPEWHFIESSEGEVELYDKGADPDEERNVASQHPELVEGFRVEIDAWKERNSRPIAADAFRAELQQPRGVFDEMPASRSVRARATDRDGPAKTLP